MSVTDPTNQQFDLAARFVNQTSQPVFLTGRAGTGKTTFLKYIKEHSFKKTVVVAPTGVAAINAAGVTMHSFFQLPFGPYIPTVQHGWNNDTVNLHSLFKNLRFNADKRALLQELELLIIDEVSMVRADMLDAMDAILRQFRHQPHLPFGGLQVLFIGDLFQLPPVVNNSEWELLKVYYKSPFFFDALVLQENPPVLIELKKIYRQSEAAFINILNRIRNNQADSADLDLLHRHYKPGFEAPEGEHFITLTSHNRNADAINQSKLSKLQEKSFEFKADLKGDFNEKALPVEMVLQLKVGAQIMFIKNDKGEFRRFYNGRIATISKIEEGKIYAVFPGEQTEILIEKEVWKNIRYSYNKEDDDVNEEELGSFTQYPIRLAWAITIHKSQGLTFEKAIVDAGASFAPGQVYVALSRLTTMDGLVLYSRILPQSIKTDERVIAFSTKEVKEDVLEQQLLKEQKIFIGRSLVKSYDWSKLHDEVNEFNEAFEHRLIPDKYAALEWAAKLCGVVSQQQEIARKFNGQLNQLLTTAMEDNYLQLHERVLAATQYFLKPLEESITSIKDHLQEYKVKQRVRKYVKDLKDLLLSFERKKQQVQQSLMIAEGLRKGVDTSDLLSSVQDKKTMITKEDASPAVPKAKKGETRNISLEMFRKGKTVTEIAILRSMVPSTIEGHLSEFILTGEVDIFQLLEAGKVKVINKVIEELGVAASSAYKQKLGESFSYGEIKAVSYWREKEQMQRV